MQINQTLCRYSAVSSTKGSVWPSDIRRALFTFTVPALRLTNARMLVEVTTLPRSVSKTPATMVFTTYRHPLGECYWL